MKRYLIILLAVLFLCFDVGCQQENEASVSSKVKEIDFLTFVAPFDYREYTYTDIKQTWDLNSNPTEFYTLDYVIERLRRPRIEDPVEFSETGEDINAVYSIEGKEYLPLVPDYYKNHYGWNYEWVADRNFFYEYASAADGTKLYRSVNADTSEVLLCVLPDGRERILVEPESVLLKHNEYSIDDFGLCVIHSGCYVHAKELERLFEAHVRGIGAVKTLDDGWGGITAFKPVYITFEYTRIPGLRYNVSFSLASRPGTGIDFENHVYIYCRVNEKMIVLDGSSGVPKDIIYRGQTWQDESWWK